MSPEPVLRQIAERAHALFHGPLPDEALHAARRCLVDWVGLVLGGLAEAPPRAVLAACAGEIGTSQVLGLPGRMLPAGSAALVMGTASHALDYDDTDYINLIHVSSTLFPALFALAGPTGLSGDALLRAVVAGFDAEDRLGFYLGRKLTACGWHVSGVIGAPGAALAAALVSGADAAEAAQAMAIASTGASGFIAAFGTMSKPLQLGRAAATGVLAAKLACQGFTGPVAGYGAPAGVVQAVIGEAIPDWSRADTGWGERFAILQNQFKPHASCMITHPIIDAASAVGRAVTDAGRRVTDAEIVECRINPLAPKVAGYVAPATGLEGKFSVAYCTALGLLFGRATPDRFAPAVVEDATVRTMTARVRALVDPQMGEQQATVRVGFADGQAFSHATAMAKGNPANPMSDRELEAKFTALATPLLGDAVSDVAAQLWAFADVPHVADWISTLSLRT